MPLALSKPTLSESARPPFEAGRKLGTVEMALVWQVLHEAPACPSRVVLKKIAQSQVVIEVSVRHLNRLRAKWKLNRSKGRPGQTAWSSPVGAGAAVVQVAPHLSYVSVHLFAHWLAQHDAFGPIVAQLTQAIEAHQGAHPDDDFALLHHREHTLLLENALLSFMATLLGYLHVKVSLDCILRILFARSGARMETDSQVIYWVNTTGLSVSYQRLLMEVVNGLCAMDLREQGKPIRVRLKALSP